MSEGTKKYDRADGKIMLELLPSGPMRDMAEVMTASVLSGKYEAHNWRLGLEWSRYHGSMMRHILAWAEGEDIDPDSGLTHLAHAGCNLMFLLEYARTKAGTDDRYKQPTVDEAEPEIVRSVPGPVIPNPVGGSNANDSAD